MKKEYNVLIGDTTGETIKKTIGNVYPGAEIKTMEVRGRDGINGLPATVKVTSEDVRKALEEPLETLLGKIRSLLEKCPPELSADIVDNGIYLTGGGALLGGFAKVLEEETGIRVFVADNPLDCVAFGTGKALDNLDKLPGYENYFEQDFYGNLQDYSVSNGSFAVPAGNCTGADYRYAGRKRRHADPHRAGYGRSGKI